MARRQGHTRQHRSPPSIRRPRVPTGERLVREHGWLTTDHPAALWYRIVAHSDDWSAVRLEVADVPGETPRALDVAVRPDGYVVPQQSDVALGAEAVRIIATAIRAAQRGGA